MDWFYAHNGERKGPVSESDLGELVASGVVVQDTLVWRSGMSEWQPFRVAAASAESPLRFCNSCGNRFPATELAMFGDSAVCANCQPGYVQRLRQGMAGAGPLALRYGGFWIRFLAYMIDVIVLEIAYYAVIVPLGLATVGVSQRDIASGIWLIPLLIGFGINFCYYAFFNSRFGATPGKMALGLKIVRPDGSPISLGQAIGRYFGYMLSGLILGVGFMMAGWDDEKRTLHDRLCDTRVIRTR